MLWGPEVIEFVRVLVTEKQPKLIDHGLLRGCIRHDPNIRINNSKVLNYSLSWTPIHLYESPSNPIISRQSRPRNQQSRVIFTDGRIDGRSGSRSNKNFYQCDGGNIENGIGDRENIYRNVSSLKEDVQIPSTDFLSRCE
jgi:hypothetical protein